MTGLEPAWPACEKSGDQRGADLKTSKTLSEGQRAYEAKRAQKAGMSLEKWLTSKQRAAGGRGARPGEGRRTAEDGEEAWSVRPPAGARTQTAIARATCCMPPRSSRMRTGASIRASAGLPWRGATASVWRLAAPAPVGDVATFLARLRCGSGRRRGGARRGSADRAAARLRSGTARAGFPALPGCDGDTTGVLPGLRHARRGRPAPAVLSGARRARDDAGGACRGARPRRRRGTVARLRPRHGGAAGRRAAVLDARCEPVRQGGDRGMAGVAAAGAGQRRERPDLAVRRCLSGTCSHRERWRWRRPIRPRRCAISGYG